MEIMPEHASRPVLGLNAAADVNSDAQDIQRAAYLIDQALLMRWMPLEVLHHKNYARAKLCWSLYNRLFVIRCAALATMVLLPYFQIPEWCHGNKDKPCGDSKVYLLSGIHYLSPAVGTFIEFLCVLPLGASLILQRYYKLKTFWLYGSTVVKAVLVFFLTLRILSVVTNQRWMFLYQGNMGAMYLHLVTAILFNSSLRVCFRMTVQILRSMLDTAVLLAGFILLAACFAYMLFHEPNFQDYPTSLLSLLIMLTTANNPNVWAETYTANRASFFFFLAYMVVGFFFLMQVLFALTYDFYKVQLALEVNRVSGSRQKTLRAAYDILDVNRDGIDSSTVIALFQDIGSYRDMQNVEVKVQRTFQYLNQRLEDKIIFSQFQVLCENFRKEAERKRDSFALEDDDDVQIETCTAVVVESCVFKFLSWGVTFGSLVMAILDRWERSVESTAKFGFSLNDLVLWEYAFGWYFFFEICMKLRVQGLQYWNSFRNCYDVLLVMLILSAEATCFWKTEATQWVSILIIIRSLRAISLLNHLTRWRLMFYLLIRMVPAAAPVLGIQYLVCSLFAILGVQLFGGLVYVGNPRLDGTEYAESGLMVYNYNDFATAMVSSFNLCIVNNWYVIMDGLVAAAGSRWARAYFISFWAISVTFTLNLVVAFFVGAFTTQLEKAEHEQSLSISSKFRHSMAARKKSGLMTQVPLLSKYDLYEELLRR